MYCTSFAYRHTAADAAAAAMFVMRNPAASGKQIKIRRIILTAGSDATTATAVALGYRICRFAPTTTEVDATGGSSPVRLNTDTKAATSVIADANIKYGAVLTTTNLTFETGYFAHLYTANANGQNQLLDLNFDLPDIRGRPANIILHQKQGLALQLAVIAVVGQQHSMTIWWEELPDK